MSDVEFLSVPIDVVEPNDYNPNSMDDVTFNELVKDISEDEMDQPIVVVENPEEDGKYIIVDGEHRWRATKASGNDSVTIVVKDWDESERMIFTMRRNLLRGTTNPKKFTDMVKKLMEKENYSLTEVRKKMGMYNEKQFAKVYLRKSEDSEKKAKELIKDAASGMQVTAITANLSQVVRDLMINHGDTLDQGFVYFMYKGKPVLMVGMDDTLQKEVTELVAIAMEDELSDLELGALMTLAISKTKELI